ncbi:hypothetical protein SAMD00023353_0802580 [Rosellinia necatrix]|uniref:Uncharacterized protein n=1 Tax=Rosellinia necatrix TaxID=77044 RepID=A0A1W2TBC1_ROSNE|nr:hypothetical protein SAMD00023353_0802580 [Rosellinia necatrix]
MMLKKPLFLAALLLAVTEGTPTQEWVLSSDSGITWTGRIEENGDIISFSGTDLQHIESQIREIQPGFSWLGTDAPGSPREAPEDDSILCDPPWNPPYASVFHIRQREP